MKVIRTFKFRCYPTKKQEENLNNVLEHSRLLYNYLLDYEKKLLESGNSALLGFSLCNLVDKNKEDIKNIIKIIPCFARLYICNRISDSLVRCFKKQKRRYLK